MDPAKDGLNWYVYVNNNPLKYVDPDGLEAKWWNPFTWFNGEDFKTESGYALRDAARDNPLHRGSDIDQQLYFDFIKDESNKSLEIGVGMMRAETGTSALGSNAELLTAGLKAGIALRAI